MHFPRGPAFLRAVPIMNPVSGVAVLLDFHDDVTGAERVHSAAWQKNRVAGLHFERMKVFLQFSLFERFQERRAGHSLGDPGVDSRPGYSISDIPKLGLRFPPEFPGDAAR